MRIYKKEAFLFRLLALGIVVFVSLFLLFPKREASRPTQEGRFVLLLTEVDGMLTPHLHVGDRVIDRQSRRILGDILDIEISESQKEIFSNAHGNFVTATVPEKYDLRLTLSAERTSGTLLSMGGDTVRLGQQYYFRTYDFTGEGRVVALL